MSKKEEYVENPKLKGSNIVDCIPHTGECPLKCLECFYNGGRFFRTLDEPWMPPQELTEGKIVRVNSGHDSNIDRGMVLRKTQHFEHVFYNTAIGKGIKKFLSPVVFTCNGGPRSRLKLLYPVPKNLMFVRVRVDSWDVETVDKAVKYYWEEHRVPIVLTFMRFYNGDLIPEEAKNDYEWRKNVTNSYWCPKVETVLRIMGEFKGRGVRTCGTPASSSCFDCRNCELLYWDCLRRMCKVSKL